MDEENAALLGEDDELQMETIPGGKRSECHGQDFSNAISYAVDSFCAVLKPVSLTMVLSALIVTHDSLSTTTSAGGLDVYTVYSIDTSTTSSSAAEKLGESLVNAVVIVAVLAAATFCIVCLYKYRFTNILTGYMVLSSGILLGVMGGQLWADLFKSWQLPCDKITFGLGCINFAVVGVIAIFWQVGIPKAMTQFYLVCTAVLLCRTLSQFEVWTGWCLLVVLAAYDLCAVMTPCGPLRILVELMEEQKTPLPGLLYEADIRTSASSSTVSMSKALSNGNIAHTHVGKERENKSEEKNSLKLGLGDFVFYSVLISKAASAGGFAVSMICFTVVLSGLGLTLFLLALHGKALPALPISISLGVVFFVFSVYAVVPFLENVLAAEIYF